MGHGIGLPAEKVEENLWEAAGKHRYLSASVAFPASVAARGDFASAPEFWWDGTGWTAGLSTRHVVPRGISSGDGGGGGRYAGGLDLTEAGDRQRYKAAMWSVDHGWRPGVRNSLFHVSLLCVL